MSDHSLNEIFRRVEGYVALRRTGADSGVFGCGKCRGETRNSRSSFTRQLRSNAKPGTATYCGGQILVFAVIVSDTPTGQQRARMVSVSRTSSACLIDAKRMQRVHKDELERTSGKVKEWSRL